MKRFKKQNSFAGNLETMTKNKIASMELLDSYEFLKLLRDVSTGFYIVYNNYSMNSMYSSNYNTARNFFEKQTNKLD